MRSKNIRDLALMQPPLLGLFLKGKNNSFDEHKIQIFIIQAEMRID